MGLESDLSRGRRVLVIEDDPAVRLALHDRLTGEGYTVQLAIDSDHGMELIRGGAYDLAILDVNLPGSRNGFDIARETRHHGVEAPILMLTARGEVTDRVAGLESGADDYLSKPFEFIELLARIEALLRRANRNPPKTVPDILESGDLRIDFRSARIFLKEQPVELSSKELQLLRFFVENSGAVLSRDELLGEVWHYDEETSTRTVDVHVARLRRKLETEPNHPTIITTVRGIGYRFEWSGLA